MGSTPAPSQCLEQHYWDRDTSKNETRPKCQSKAFQTYSCFPKSWENSEPSPLPGLCAILHLDCREVSVWG